MDRVIIIGIGGCGSNVLTGLVDYGFAADDLVVMNTDLDSLMAHSCQKKLLIPIQSERPKEEIARFFLDRDHRAEFENFIHGNAAAFLIAGLGGKTGTILLQQAADISRSMGLMTIALGVKPFRFEGKVRNEEANQALTALKSTADVTIAVENDALFRLLPGEMAMSEAFGYLNQYIARLVESCVHVFTTTEKSLWVDELYERFDRVVRDGVTVSFHEDFD